MKAGFVSESRGVRAGGLGELTLSGPGNAESCGRDRGKTDPARVGLTLIRQQRADSYASWEPSQRSVSAMDMPLRRA